MEIKKSRKTNSFDPQAFLETAGVARQVAEFWRSESIFTQGDVANSVVYIQVGRVKVSVVSGSRKEAVVAKFGPSDYFSEDRLAGQLIPMGTATASTRTTTLVVDKKELSRVLHPEHPVGSRSDKG